MSIVRITKKLNWLLCVCLSANFFIAMTGKYVANPYESGHFYLMMFVILCNSVFPVSKIVMISSLRYPKTAESVNLGKKFSIYINAEYFSLLKYTLDSGSSTSSMALLLNK